MSASDIIIVVGVLLGGYIILKNMQGKEIKQPSFVENFTGTSLNSNAWNIRTWPDCNPDKTVCNNYLTSNVVVGDGMLKLNITTPKSGGAIRSKDSYGYGTYEVRMKFAGEGTDMGSDFWLNTITDTVYESIDIEYWKYYPDGLLLSIYSGYDANHKAIKVVAERKFFGYDLSKDFHIFKIEKFPGRVTWYMDNVKVQEYIGDQAPSHGQGIKLDCYNPYWRPDNATTGSMLVDYIKFTPY